MGSVNAESRYGTDISIIHHTEIISVDKKLTCPFPELNTSVDELTLGVSEFINASLIPPGGDLSLIHPRFPTQSGLHNIAIFFTLLNSYLD